jgi:hypothetical protein
LGVILLVNEERQGPMSIDTFDTGNSLPARVSINDQVVTLDHGGTISDNVECHSPGQGPYLRLSSRTVQSAKRPCGRWRLAFSGAGPRPLNSQRIVNSATVGAGMPMVARPVLADIVLV